MTVNTPSARELAATVARLTLKAFLDADCTLDCRPQAFPKASILIPVCNRAELTLTCLQSLVLGHNKTPYEIIIVNNNSTDETEQLLRRVHGLQVIHNETNVGFPRSVNQAASVARGAFLILLNNDVQVLGKSIDRVVEFLEANQDVGAAGGQVVLLDGTLQEAGVTIGQNGWTLQCGRGQSPDDPAYRFQRDVDYCSGAFLATRRDLFLDLAGLDECFSPGYFEECDYCARLAQLHRRVVYLPDVKIIHFESATSSSLFDVNHIVGQNHLKFLKKHAEWLATQPAPGWSALSRRTSRSSQINVLILESSARVVAGLSEIEDIIQRIECLDGFVTFCLVGRADPMIRTLLARLGPTVEIFCLDQAAQLQEWVASRSTYYDLIVTQDAELTGSYTLPAYSCTKRARMRAGKIELIEPSDFASSPIAGAA